MQHIGLEIFGLTLATLTKRIGDRVIFFVCIYFVFVIILQVDKVEPEPIY